MKPGILCQGKQHYVIHLLGLFYDFPATVDDDIRRFFLVTKSNTKRKFTSLVLDVYDIFWSSDLPTTV